MIKSVGHKHKLINNLKTYYSTYGNKQSPPIVVLHCWGARLKGLSRIGSSLAKSYYVIVPELPGFVRSDPPQDHWTPIEYAQHINKLLEILKVSNFIILGHSFGGAIATEYSNLFSNKIKSLILIETIMTDYSRGPLFDLIFNIGSKMDKTILNSKKLPSYLKKLVLTKLHGVPENFINNNNIDKYGYFLSQDINIINVDYPKVPVQKLFIWSSSFVSRYTRKRAKEIVNSDFNSKLVIYNGNHLTFYFNPSRITKIITQWHTNLTLSC